MTRWMGGLLALALTAGPAAAWAQGSAPGEDHNRTSYHAAQATYQPAAATPDKSASKDGDFVEYFSVPVPGGPVQYGAPPPPAYAPLQQAQAPAPVPQQPQPNNPYWDMANDPYPFGIANYTGDVFDAGYGGYGGYGSYGGYGYGGLGYGYGYGYGYPGSGFGFGGYGYNGCYGGFPYAGFTNGGFNFAGYGFNGYGGYDGFHHHQGFNNYPSPFPNFVPYPYFSPFGDGTTPFGTTILAMPPGFPIPNHITPAYSPITHGIVPIFQP